MEFITAYLANVQHAVDCFLQAFFDTPLENWQSLFQNKAFITTLKVLIIPLVVSILLIVLLRKYGNRIPDIIKSGITLVISKVLSVYVIAFAFIGLIFLCGAIHTVFQVYGVFDTENPITWRETTGGKY